MLRPGSSSLWGATLAVELAASPLEYSQGRYLVWGAAQHGSVCGVLPQWPLDSFELATPSPARPLSGQVGRTSCVLVRGVQPSCLSEWLNIVSFRLLDLHNGIATLQVGLPGRSETQRSNGPLRRTLLHGGATGPHVACCNIVAMEYQGQQDSKQPWHSLGYPHSRLGPNRRVACTSPSTCWYGLLGTTDMFLMSRAMRLFSLIHWLLLHQLQCHTAPAQLQGNL